VNFNPGGTLFHADSAARHHHHVGYCRHRGGHGGVVHGRSGYRHPGYPHHTRAIHGHGIYHHSNSFSSAPWRELDLPSLGTPSQEADYVA
jgi:hypothetical protein